MTTVISLAVGVAIFGATLGVFSLIRWAVRAERALIVRRLNHRWHAEARR